ncbi:hypothetical protein PUNSTDRAFT_123065 [Punctularia strigosozonata HHB-11173 SS5]|uniref:Uncharacterized protein n=1 Tax=Punctularia strigosozonata (strain HHB-11173) TaxID=741275 RepID=R7S450_PUNST|nr:uncharacterized protein PUNSTDRAFT_123065 [Punctularia strigosozonata HHB-11173 SS5]EIN04016.1 hypothetical protein PUNSTDRAFT_123065 [Punctularia strigosozonata HHB-11173 SS5]
METFARKAGLKVFEKHLEQYKPADPLYEYYTDKKGRQKRRKRELPPGLSKRDARILKSVKRRAHYLDKGFKLCGFQFGWTFVIGIIPGAGDIADATLNYVLVLRKCQQADLPSWLMRKMLVNNLVSAGVGLVPLVGDVVLAQWKANSRNALLLEEFLRIRGEEFLAQQASPNRPNASTHAAVVRPGAGLQPGETIPHPDPKTDAIPADKVPAADRAAIAGKEAAVDRGTGQAATTDSTAATEGVGAGVQPSSSSGSWWKGKGKGKEKEKAAAKPGDKGKFVEHVNR